MIIYAVSDLSFLSVCVCLLKIQLFICFNSAREKLEKKFKIGFSGFKCLIDLIKRNQWRIQLGRPSVDQNFLIFLQFSRKFC